MKNFLPAANLSVTLSFLTTPFSPFHTTGGKADSPLLRMKVNAMAHGTVHVDVTRGAGKRHAVYKCTANQGNKHITGNFPD